MNAYALRYISDCCHSVITNLNTYGAATLQIVRSKIDKLAITNLNTYGAATEQIVRSKLL